MFYHPVPPDVTSWNPEDNSDATLLAGNLPTPNYWQANFQTTLNTFHSVRTNTSKTSGKWMTMAQINAIDALGGWALGISNQRAPLLQRAGATQDSVGAQFAANAQRLITYGISEIFYSLLSNTRDQIAMCLDADAGLVWWNNFSENSGWTNANENNFTGNPSTGVGGTRLGFTPSVDTPAYIIGSGYYGNRLTDAIMINPQCYGFTASIPFLFSSWDPLTITFTVAEPC